jgi:hypothetical protein
LPARCHSVTHSIDFLFYGRTTGGREIYELENTTGRLAFLARENRPPGTSFSPDLRNIGSRFDGAAPFAV